ncbi:MAG: ABC transporter substrate-binding protein [Firmicutes bacterium]|nr:ABC transporter substrate-binding protein [Bacillota bacterium]
MALNKAVVGLLVVVSVLMTGTAAMAQSPVVMTYLEGQVITTIDPAKHTDESSLHIVLNQYDPLLYPKDAEGSMEPGPHIATDWTVSDDGLTYTFNIRRGVKFHDGTELTAEDVKFSFDRMMAIGRGYSWLWEGVVREVEVRDDHTVAFHLHQPYAPFLSTLIQLFIVNKDLVMANLQAGEFGEYGDYGQKFLEENVAGSGPYMKERWSRGSEYVMVRFDDYWRGWQPGQVERVHYKIVLEEAVRKTMLRAGEADMIDQWASVETFNDLKRTPGVIVDEQPSAQLFHLPLNTQKAPTDNLHVRKALAYAFDYETALKYIFPGAVQARGPVPVLAYGHNPDVPVFTFDLEKAREHLALAGYEPGELTIDFVYSASVPMQEKVGLMWQAHLAEIGINLNIRPEPWGRVTELSTSVDTTPHVLNIFDTLKYPHADSHTFGMYHPSAHGSYRATAWLDVPEITETLEAARRAVTEEEQLELYGEAQRLIVEQVPSVFVANPVHRIAFRDHVKGYRYVGLLGFDVAFYNFTIEQ